MNRSRRTDERRRGVATVEFALVAPFILLLLLGGADLIVYMRTAMRVDETATEVAQVVTQYNDLYQSDFTTLFNDAQTIAGTTPVTGLLGATIISGIVNSNGTQTIAWQRRSPSATFSSQFGRTGSVPTLPNNYMLPTGGVLITIEVATSTSPWFFSLGLMPASNITSVRAYALFQPRLASLATVTAGNRP